MHTLYYSYIECAILMHVECTILIQIECAILMHVEFAKLMHVEFAKLMQYLYIHSTIHDIYICAFCIHCTTYTDTHMMYTHIQFAHYVYTALYIVIHIYALCIHRATYKDTHMMYTNI